jgi:hypothetical protein
MNLEEYQLPSKVLTTLLMETYSRYVHKRICITAVHMLNSFHAKSGNSD